MELSQINKYGVGARNDKLHGKIFKDSFAYVLEGT